MNNKIELKKLSLSMGKAEYEMFQDIPAKESGSTNLCNGLSYEVFPAYIENQLSREFNKISDFDTPTIIYIAYYSDYPIGYVGIRTKINNKWKKWSGNVFYAVRLSERGKHFGTMMLESAFEVCKKLGMKTVYLQSSKGNIASQKVIENNKCTLIKVDGSRYYKKNLQN